MTSSPPSSAPSAAADPVSLLEGAVRAAAALPALDDRLDALLGAAPALGFARAVLSVRGDALRPLGVHAAGLRAAERAALAGEPVSGAVWRRRLRLLARRVGGDARDLAVVLHAHDPWVRQEFEADLAPLGDEVTRDLLVLAPAGRDGEVLVTLVLECGDARSGADSLALARLLARQLAHEVAQTRLTTLAARRAARLQQLHEAGAALARSLDEQEIVRELARQVARLLPHDGLTVAHPDLESGTVRTGARLVGGEPRARREVALGAGVVAEVARTGRSVRVDDFDAHATPLAADDLVGDDGPAASALAAPMRVGTQLVGVVGVWSATPHAYGAEDEELLRTVAAQAGTAVANARLYAESERERRQSEALAEVARAVGESLRLGEVLRLTLRHTTALLGAAGACVALQRDDLLHIVAAVGGAELLAGVHLPMDGSMMGQAVRERRAIVSNAVPTEPAHYRPLARFAHLEKTVIVPLVTAGGAIGVLAALNRGDDFGDEDARVLQRLADHVAVAIVNARLFEDLASATREWKATFDAIATGVAVVDEQGRVMRCNQRAAELAGAAAPKALLGHGLAQRLDPDHPAVVAALVDDAAARDGSVAAVLARTVRDGEPARATVRVGDARVLDLVVAPHPDGGAVVAFDDVTADRERAAALARADARYTRLVEAASDAIVTVDAAGRITSVNRAFERGMGIDRERVLGIPFVALLRDDGAEMRRVFEDTIRGERVRRELRYADAASAERVASIITAPIVEDGRVQGALAVIRDVTDERRMAEQLLQREKLAAVGQLVSGIAQELRNPLDAVLANAGALLQGDGDAASREASARAAHAEATRAARIVDKLMAFARPHAPERSPTDVNRVLLDALELRRFALRLQQVDIALDLDYDLPATWADPYQLEQVFLDLLTNAEHALARGGAGAAAARRVTLRSRRDGDALAVTVADTGPGLGAEQLARVFQPFFTTKPVGAGAGFGLAIADRLVRAHGGAITVDTAPGRGAAFTVRLPVVAAPATDT